MANTHLIHIEIFPDAKLWQSLVDQAVRRLLQPAAGDLALYHGRGSEQGPDSSVYEFLATQGVSRGHPDLQPRHTAQGFPVNVLPDARQIAHRLPLVSSYASVLGVEPDFTNLTQQFRGTLDYIWRDSSAIRCAAVAPVPPLRATHSSWTRAAVAAVPVGPRRADRRLRLPPLSRIIHPTKPNRAIYLLWNFVLSSPATAPRTPSPRP